MPSVAPLPPVHFSGNWLLDQAASDSLEPLLAYHGDASTPAAALGLPESAAWRQHSIHSSSTILTTSDGSRTLTSVSEADESRSRANSNLRRETSQSSSSSSTLSVPPSPTSASPRSHSDASVLSAIPALIIQHSSRHLITYLHGLIPRYDPATGALTRYDPLDPSGQQVLKPHEEHRLDGEYHLIQTPRGKVEARAYTAPHGQSVLVDTRCASKYDLERVERFLEKNGTEERLVMEIRILSCDPNIQAPRGAVSAAGVSQKFAPPSANNKFASPQRSPGKRPVASPPSRITPGQVVVKELLFLRRVFTRILDADPQREEKERKEKEEMEQRRQARLAQGSSGVHLPAFGSDASGLGSSEHVAPGLLDFDAEETVNHVSPVKPGNVGAARRKGEERNGSAAAATSVNAVKGVNGSFLPPEGTIFSPAAQAILPRELTRSTPSTDADALEIDPSPSSSTSWSTRARAFLLYPRTVLLRRYDLTELVDGGLSAAATMDPEMRESFLAAAAKERQALEQTRRHMMIIDLVLVLIVIYVVLTSLGMKISFDAPSSDPTSYAESAAAMAQYVKERAVEISNVAVTITTPPPPAAVEQLAREL